MITAARIVAVLGPKFRVDPDTGDVEKQCSRCKRVYGDDESWWPADSDFYTRDAGNGPGRLHSWCRACNIEGRPGHGHPPGEVSEERREARRRFNIELGLSAGTYDNWRQPSKLSGGYNARFDRA